MRVKRLTPVEVRQLERAGERCEERHPNWRGVRCERRKDDERLVQHDTHHAEARTFEWIRSV